LTKARRYVMLRCVQKHKQVKIIMELLVATLVRVTRNNQEDATIRVRMIVDTVRNAPGVSNVRFYQSRESESYCVLLSTWEDEGFWQRGQERYNPRSLLLTSTHDLLAATPEQWQLNYLWGYSRPAAQPAVAAIHLATVRPDQVEQVQQTWIENLRRQAAAPTLAFAFLARGDSQHWKWAGRAQQHLSQPAELARRGAAQRILRRLALQGFPHLPEYRRHHTHLRPRTPVSAD
jgi:hypothetical protein